MNNSTLRWLIFVLFAILSPSAFSQGSLTPPGAPAPTMKTLDEIEPRTNLQGTPLPSGVTTDVNNHFVIESAGSYYLSANLVVTKPNGIKINVEGVTLDLNGFEISRASALGGSGIEIVATAHRASVRNGSIKGFSTGVSSLFSGSFPRGCSFLDLALNGCTTRGTQAGEGAVLEYCRAHGNSGADGIAAGPGCTLNNCAATNSTTTHGITAGVGSTLVNCTANGNAPPAAGSPGAIVANTGSTLINCSVQGNTVTNGIFAGAGSSLTNCSAQLNTATYGIFADSGSSLTNCSANANTSASATSAGIGTGIGSTVTNCTASLNDTTVTTTPTTGMGFELDAGSTIQGCNANTNSGDGINVQSTSLVLGNSCRGNGVANPGNAAGIHTTGADNRIDGNNVAGNDRGIDVDGAGSLIVRNSASGNTLNYDIAASNHDAQRITNPGTAFVSTDPWANFVF